MIVDDRRHRSLSPPACVLSEPRTISHESQAVLTDCSTSGMIDTPYASLDHPSAERGDVTAVRLKGSASGARSRSGPAATTSGRHWLI